MTPRQTALAAAVALSLGACASVPPPPPVPGLDGSNRRPANSPAVLEMLHRERLAAASEPSRETRDRLMRARYLGALAAAKPVRSRPVDPGSRVQLPGATASVSRTITVPFVYGATRFSPDPATGYALREQLSSAERVEVRGRTDGRGLSRADELTARARAESARMWLIERGMPPQSISVNYFAGGDYIASSAGPNRRVEVEFFFDEPLVEVSE